MTRTAQELLAVMEDRKPHRELTALTRACILHALCVLTEEPCSELANSIKKLYKELYVAVTNSDHSKKRRSSVQMLSLSTVDIETPLGIDLSFIDDYKEGISDAKDLCQQMEQKLNGCMTGDFVHDSLFRACWKIYRERKRPDKIVTEFSGQHPPESDDSMYLLWLIFNAVLPSESIDMKLPVKCLDVIMDRLFDLCGHECSSEELVHASTSEMLDYPGYLMAIANYNEKFKLKTSLTCEVIQDLRDEIVDAVLKKSYLTKKGHMLKSWRRRWFVLQKTVMRYFESKEKPILKGQMVLNDKTIAEEIPDQGRRKHCFRVVCGKTGKSYEISADDEKSRHKWILAIKKAIGLAAILSGKEEMDVPEFPSDAPHHVMSNFHSIRFRSSQSIIPKWAGAIKQVSSIGLEESNMSEDEDEEQSRSLSLPVPTGRQRSNSVSAVDRECVLIPPSNLLSAKQDGLSASDSDLAAIQDRKSGVYEGCLGSFIIENIHDSLQFGNMAEESPQQPTTNKDELELQTKALTCNNAQGIEVRIITEIERAHAPSILDEIQNYPFLRTPSNSICDGSPDDKSPDEKSPGTGVDAVDP